jgi:elongation factor 1-beta
MANAIVTIRIMPESPDVDLQHLLREAEKKIDHFIGSHKQKQHEIKPVAFGLKSLDIHFMMDEAKGSPDPVAEAIEALDGVQSAEVTNVTRPMG